MAGAEIRGGVGFYTQGMGAEPHLTAGIHAGVEFEL